MTETVTIQASLEEIRQMIRMEIHAAMATKPDRLLTTAQAKREIGIKNHKSFLALELPHVMVRNTRYYSLNLIQSWKKM